MNPEDIGTAVSALKMRIQKARAELEGMPDMHRTVEEQREEIDELEGRIREQRRIIMGVVERMGNGV